MTASKNMMTSLDDGLDEYFLQIRKYTLLNFETELELSRQIEQGDEAAKLRLIQCNLRLVVKIARQYLTSGINLLDLIQEGNLGLMHAAEKYDYRHGAKFSSYASWWIKQAVVRAISNKKRAIRLPHRKEELLRNLNRSFSRLSQDLMRKPSMQELASDLGISLEEAHQVLSVGATPLSMDSEFDDDALNMHDVCQDFTYAPERIMEHDLVKEQINQLLSKLEQREQLVLRHRYALGGDRKETLKDLSARMGVSPETIRQIEMKAIKKMREISLNQLELA